MASNVNYPMAATYALLMFGELLDDPRYTLRSKELLLVPTVLVSDRFPLHVSLRATAKERGNLLVPTVLRGNAYRTEKLTLYFVALTCHATA